MKKCVTIPEPKGGEELLRSNDPKPGTIFSIRTLVVLAVVFALMLTGVGRVFAAEPEECGELHELNDSEALAECCTGDHGSLDARGGATGVKVERPGAEDEQDDDYRRWAQADPRWGDIRLGTNGRTVAQAGCLVTSITKLIIQSGYRDQESFNVATLVNWLNANGGLSADGNLYWQKPAEMIDGLEFDEMNWNGGYSSNSAFQERLMALVRANKHIVLTVNNFGHYVAVDNAKSLEQGVIYIMDSLNNTAGNADIPLSSRYSYVSRICTYVGNNGDSSNYIARCTFSMTHCIARVTSQSAYLYTLPCTENVGEGSSWVRRVPVGSLIEITADLMNPLFEHWHQVLDEDGHCYYMWTGCVEFEDYINDVQVEAIAPPTGMLQLGHWYSLSENVLSRHNITCIVGRITDEDSNVIFQGAVTPNVHGGFDISDTAIDASLLFGSLPAGHYHYELIADVHASCYLTRWTTDFRRIFVSPFSIAVDPLGIHTVTFIDPVTNEQVERELIYHGFYAVMPPLPVHQGYDFTAWPIEGQRIYSDMTVTAGDGSGILMGDANGNGTVDMTDALTVLRFAMGSLGNSYINLAASDFNGDGTVDINDALAIMRAAM